MLKTSTLTLLETKQHWELSDSQLREVHADLGRMMAKLGTEISFRMIADGVDTPIAEAMGG